MFFSLSIVVSLSLLASSISVSALTTPHAHAHNARDLSLAARNHHHHIARRASPHPVSRRSARRKRCVAPTSLPIDVASQPHHTTTTTSAPSTTTTPSNGGGGETHSGDGTFFDVGLGACGQWSIDSDFMVAIGWQLFDSFATGDSVNNPNLNPVCGRKIRASYGGKSVDVVALDRCGGCQEYDLDFSPSAFSQLADFDVGRLKNVQWQFI